jgi:polyisoprenoid-binding protein YceI
MATWNIDPVHSAVEFSVRHMMMTTVRGNFDGFSATLNFDENNPAASSVEAEIQTETVNTRTADRDNHLRSPDFFDAANHPTMFFSSKNINITGDNTGTVTGDLTIKGVTREVTLDVEYFGQQKSPFGDFRASFNATGKINREDFGLTWNQALETGGVLVGKEVKINLDLQFVKVEETETVAAGN